jgi:hypothetical protein
MAYAAHRSADLARLASMLSGCVDVFATLTERDRSSTLSGSAVRAVPRVTRQGPHVRRLGAMTSGRENRRHERHPADWAGEYSTDSTTAWYGCRVVDVSATGAGVELFGPDVPAGSRLVLKLQANPSADAGTTVIEVAATVMNASTVAKGIVRVGLEFVNLAPVEQEIMLSGRLDSSG